MSTVTIGTAVCGSGKYNTIYKEKKLYENQYRALENTGFNYMKIRVITIDKDKYASVRRFFGIRVFIHTTQHINFSNTVRAYKN